MEASEELDQGTGPTRFSIGVVPKVFGTSVIQGHFNFESDFRGGGDNESATTRTDILSV
jgi:hypothetical protein